jgi:hypothetical protein
MNAVFANTHQRSEELERGIHAEKIKRCSPKFWSFLHIRNGEQLIESL